MPKFAAGDVVTLDGRHTPSPDVLILEVINDGSDGSRVEYGCRYLLDDSPHPQLFIMNFDDSGFNWVKNDKPFVPEPWPKYPDRVEDIPAFIEAMRNRRPAGLDQAAQVAKMDYQRRLAAGEIPGHLLQPDGDQPQPTVHRTPT